MELPCVQAKGQNNINAKKIKTPLFSSDERKKPEFWEAIIGLRAQITYWALASTENWTIQGWVNGNEWFKPKIQWAKYRWEDGPRRNISLDMINKSHICVLTIMMTFQEAPMIKMCIMNFQGWWDLRNILEKVAITALNALQLLS